MPEVDETELGDDPFARGGEGVNLDSGNEAWLKSDRDYTYDEVRPSVPLYRPIVCIGSLPVHSSSTGFMANSTHLTLLSLHLPVNVTPSHRRKSCVKETRRPSSPTSPISASVCTGNRSTSSNTCSPKWVLPGPSTVPVVSLSRVVSSRSRSSTSFVDTSVRSPSLSVSPFISWTHLPCSRVRHMQDVQIAGYAPHEGEPYILHVVRIMRIPAVRQRDQNRFPGAGREEKQEQDWLNGPSPCLVYTVCIRLDTALYHMHAVYTIEATCIALIPVRNFVGRRSCSGHGLDPTRVPILSNVRTREYCADCCSDGKLCTRLPLYSFHPDYSDDLVALFNLKSTTVYAVHLENYRPSWERK